MYPFQRTCLVCNENDEEEVACFFKIFNDDIVRNILDQMNLCALQPHKNKELDSPTINWVDVA